MSGYSHDKGTLEGMTNQLRDGANVLDVAIGTVPGMVDAGASSKLVATALQDVLETGSAAATKLEGMSEQIDATSGAYADVENTNAGSMKQEEQKSLGQRAAESGPL